MSSGQNENLLASANLITMRVLLSCLLLWFSSLVQAQAGLPVTELGIGMFRVQAEVADTQGSRARGLMYRRTLPAHTGMLFVFEQPAEQCFWMKNTLLPLSIAFIDDAGHIVNVEDMQPMTETSHCSAKPVRYALEMNQGWFQSKGFGPGTPVRGIVR